MKNKGFTLVEILAVIILIGLITILAVPAINSATSKSKERILQTKLDTAKKALMIWNNDNINCFRTIDAIDCIVGLNNGCIKSNNILTCEITLRSLAENNIIKYDNESEKLVINPVNNNSLNNEKITFTYNIDKNIFSYN